MKKKKVCFINESFCVCMRMYVRIRIRGIDVNYHHHYTKRKSFLANFFVSGRLVHHVWVSPALRHAKAVGDQMRKMIREI